MEQGVQWVARDPAEGRAAMIETIDVLIADLPSALRFVRYGRGKSLRQVAEETGLSYSFLSMVETGRATPNTVRARTIAKWVLG